MGDVRVSEDVVTQVAQTAVVRPGDKLIVRVSQGTPAADAERIRDALSKELPGVEVLMIGGVEEMAIYRSDPLHNVEMTTEDAARRIGRQSSLRRRTG